MPTVQIFTGVFSIENTDGTLVQNTGGVMEIETLFLSNQEALITNTLSVFP